MNMHTQVEFARQQQPWLREWAAQLDSVLEIGPEAGILAIEALHMGARRAYVIHSDTTPVWLEQMRAANQMADRLICLNGDSQRLAPPEQVGAILFQPLRLDDLGTRSFQLKTCYERWLQPGGKLIQETLDLTIQPLLGQHHWQELTLAKAGLLTQLQALTRYSLNQIYTANQQILADASPNLWKLRMSLLQAYQLKATCRFELHACCCIQGLVVGLNNANHWWLPLSRILDCQAGDSLEVELRCIQTRMGTFWSWSASLGEITTKQTNLFASPENLVRWGVKG